ncbi:hypothetical protein [Kordia jejudonensis]|uniref:hypothetical protein n=1 Tax=Kordia jejudonensis TaxID=1348245 RepID=UPI000629592C|nr:hypothetical protein [Kordia jejudonensis]
MKKKDLKSKLTISKKTVSTLESNATKGGTGNTFRDCGPSNNAMCTFGDCFSQGPGCSRWQVC